MYENYGLVNGKIPFNDYPRARMRGVNVGVDGAEYPRVSRRDYRVLANAGKGYDDVVLNQVLARLCTPGSEAWMNFMATRGGNRVRVQGGPDEFDVVRLKEPRYVPPWEARKLAAAKNDTKVKKYTLAQIFADTYVRDKYDIPVKVMASVVNLALTSPADAAATVQDCMMRKSAGGVRIKVTAGAYASGVQAAVRDIHMMAMQKPPVQIGTPATVIGEWMYLQSGESYGSWEVKGPLMHAGAIADIHRIALTAGVHETIFCFGVETAKLHIDIVLKSGEVVGSTILGHAGASGDFRYMLDSGLEDTLSGALLDKCRLLKENVQSLCEGQSPRATALQLNDKVLLVNQHVLETMSKPQVRGKSLGARQVVGGDLWAFGCKSDCQRWTFREPSVGEMACIMYHNGLGVVLSPAFPVVGSDGMYLLSERVEGVVPGMSGGAVVALSDFSLLGVHCGETMSRLRATRITETVFYDICDFVTETSDGESGNVEPEDNIEYILKTRGLARRVREVVKSLVPVYSGADHVGTAVKVRDTLFSALSGTRRVSFGRGDSREVNFESVDQSLLSVAYDRKLPSLEKERTPQVGEAVVCLGVDGFGPITTGELRVTHVGPFSRNFSITLPEASEYSLTGALVLALHDGAVLGVAVSRSVRGGGMFAVTLPETVAGRRDVKDVLSKVFPLMEVSMWEGQPLQNVFDQSTGLSEVRGLAQMGETHIRLQVMRELVDKKIPYNAWAETVGNSLSSDTLARVFWDFELEDLVELPSDDLSTGLSVEQAACTMLALLAVAFENEGSDKTVEWLKTVGIVSIGARPGLGLRRPSGFSVLAPDGRELKPYGDD